MMNKQYDWFATRIFQPELSIDELFDQGITPENTGFKTRDDYRNMASVRDQFRTEDGGFDEDAFNDAYNSSREMYNLYTNREYNKKLLEEFAYDPYEWYAPATGEIIDVSASNTPTRNGMFYSTNVAGIGENTESPYSVREIAQQQLVHDENGNELDWTPEDKGGLLKGLVRDSLVLATYDEDTPEYDEDGNLLTIHKKGEYKLNEWGAPYYELLGDRDAYGKELLHYTDTFTKEGSVLNKIDFYDSDDKRKSVFGTAMKTASQIVPMFLPNPIKYTWGAINAAKGIGQSLSALGKGIDSIITGDDDDEFGRNLTKLENWLSRFDQSKSDYGKTHMWGSAETYGDLFGSVAKQLFEQRVIASIPRHLKFLGPDIKRSKLGQDMAIAYMAATSAKESYASGIEAGLGDRQAGLLLLANTAAMWKLMDSDYGRSTLFKGSWFDDDISKKTAKETADFMVKGGDKKYAMKDINEKMGEYGSTKLVKAVKNESDEAIKGIGKPKKPNTPKTNTPDTPKSNINGESGAAADNKEVSTIRSAREFLKTAYKKYSDNLKTKLENFKGIAEPDEYKAAMLREGLEEVIEEGIMDVTKATTLALESLGVKMNDTGEKLDYGFSSKDIFDRYLLSFIGGSIGGGIFRAYNSYELLKDSNWKYRPDYQRDLIFLIADGRSDELIQEYKNLYNKGLLGSTELKSSFKMSEGENADVVGENDLSQADANLKILVGNVRFIKQVLNDEGLFDAIKKSKDKNIVTTRNLIWNNDDHTEKRKRGLFLMSHLVGAHQLMTHSFLKLADDFVTARTWKVGLTEDLRKKDNLTPEEQSQLENINSQYEKRIKELRENRDDLLAGKYNGDFVSSILLETEGILPSINSIGKIDKNAWALSHFHKSYDALDDVYKYQVDRDMEDYFTRAHNFYGRDFAHNHDAAKRVYLGLQRIMKKEFESQNDELKGKKMNDFHMDNYFGEEYFRIIDKTQELEYAIAVDKATLQDLKNSQNVTSSQKQIADIEENIRLNEEKLQILNIRKSLYEFKEGDVQGEQNVQNFIPRNMLLQGFKGDYSQLQKLVDSYHQSIIAKTNELKVIIPNILNQILSIYETIKNENGIVRDLGELKMAEQVMINYAKRMLEEFEFPLSVLADRENIENPKGFYRGDAANIFNEQLKNFIEALESNKADKYKKAKSAYNKIAKLVDDTADNLNIEDTEYVSFLEDIEDDVEKQRLLDNEKEYVRKAFYFPDINEYTEPIENPFDIFFKIVETTAELNKHPFSKVLSVFNTLKGDVENNTAMHFVESQFDKYVSTKDWKDFFIANTNDQELLSDLIYTINLMKLLISTDPKVLELMNEFYKDEDKLVVFDPLARKNLIQGLETLKNKIYTVLQNGLRNSGNRHAEIEKDYKRRTLNEVQNLLKFWGDIEDDEFKLLEIWDSIAESSKYSSELKKDKFETISTGSITEDQFTDFYAKIKQFESKLFDQWQVLTKDITGENANEIIADKFISLFEKSKFFEKILLEEAHNPYDKQNQGTITPIETFRYLLEIISVKSSILDSAYTRALEQFKPVDGDNNPRVPNDEQERAVKSTSAFISNHKVWTSVRKKLQEKAKTYKWTNDRNKKIADFISNIKILENTYIVSGACGVGKSSMVGAVMQHLWGGVKETIFNAPTKENADNITATFGESTSYKTISEKKELFKFLFGDKATNEFDLKLDKNNVNLEINNRSQYKFLKPSKEHIEDLKKYSVLVIDEIGQYNEIELRLIDEIAKKANIFVFGLGDHCQIGDIVTFTDNDNKKQRNSSNYRELSVWTAPYLVRSMRSASIAKTANNEKLGRNIFHIESQVHLSDTELSNAIKEGMVEGQDISTKLMYSDQLNYGFCGDKIVNDSEIFDDDAIHILKTLRDNETVSIVIDSDEKQTKWTEKLKSLSLADSDKIKFRRLDKNQINGYETTYAIVDVNWKGKNGRIAWKEFYTISQRSYRATLFLDATNSLSELHITSELDPDSARIWRNNPEFVKNWYEKRMSWTVQRETTPLFKNKESIFNINIEDDDDEPTGTVSHSSTPVEAPPVETPPMVTPPSESKSAEDELKEKKKEEAEKQKKSFELKQSNWYKKLNENKLDINNSTFVENYIQEINNSSVTENLERKQLIDKLLKEHSSITESFKDLSAENKNSFKESMKAFEKHGNILRDLLNELTTKLNENDKDEENKSNIEEALNFVLNNLSEVDETLSFTEQLEQVENNIKLITDFETEYGQNEGLPLQTWVARKDKLNSDLLALQNKFRKDNPVQLDSDDIEDVNIESLTKDQKTKLISKINTVVSEYNKKLDSIKSETNKDVEEFANERITKWGDRILELKKLKEDINKSIEPEPVKNQNVDKLYKKAIEAKKKWDEWVELKKEGNKLADEKLPAVKYSAEDVVRYAEEILKTERLSPEEQNYVETIYKNWKHSFEALAKEKAIVSEIRTEKEINESPTFDVKQTDSSELKTSVDEFKIALEQRDTEVICERKFTKNGLDVFNKFKDATKDGQILKVWGLDLETTGLESDREIVQVGLVQYEISRKGEEWFVKEILDSKYDVFVQPTDGDKTPPETINDEPNVIYEPWTESKRKNQLVSEIEALYHLLDVLTGDYLITYNGKFDIDTINARVENLSKKLDLSAEESEKINELQNKITKLNRMMNVDVYIDFITIRSDYSGDLLWNIEDGKKKTIPRLGSSRGHRTLQTISSKIQGQLETGSAHSASSDVNSTLNVLLNMFNGIPIFRDEQKFVSSNYTETFTPENLFIKDYLIPYVESQVDKFKVSKEDIYVACVNARHSILNKYSILDDDSVIEAKWVYDESTNRSILVYTVDDFEDLPLLVVSGKRSGTVKAKFKHKKSIYSKRAATDLDLVEMWKQNQNLRFSKPFVLTGLRGDQIIPLDELTKGALSFYTPGKINHNVGKTFVLYSENPTLRQNWDPRLALAPNTEHTTSEDENGNVIHHMLTDWRDMGYEMLTVSRSTTLQEKIDFSIAGCNFAADVVSSKFMSDFFNPLKNNRKNNEPYITIAGVTLARTEYESLFEDKTAGERRKIFNSEIFSVMDNRKVGNFFAAFVNGCIANKGVENLLEYSENSKIEKPLHQWVVENLISSLIHEPHFTGWQNGSGGYYSLDFSIGGETIKLIYDLSTSGFYLFKVTPGMNIEEKLKTIKNSTNINDGIWIEISNKILGNTYEIIENEFLNYFGKKSIEELVFDKIELVNTYVKTISDTKKEIRSYPVSTAESFTRAFTSWDGDAGQAYGLRGWNNVYDQIKDQMLGFQLDLFGHEIINKSDSLDNTIFSYSVCNNCLNGDYIARTTKLIQYGGWTLIEGIKQDNSFRELIEGKLELVKQKTTESFAQYVSERLNLDEVEKWSKTSNLSKDEIEEINDWFVKRLNALSLEFYGSGNKIVTFAITPSGFECNKIFKTKNQVNKDLFEKLQTKMEYYWVSTDGQRNAYIQFKNNIPVKLCVQNINEEVKSKDLTGNDLESLLFKNLLVSLWDKKFLLDKYKNEKGDFITYLISQLYEEIPSDVKRAFMEGIKDSDVKYSIFTDEIKKMFLNLTDADVTGPNQSSLLVLPINMLYNGNDFFKSLIDSHFDIFALITKLC